MFGLNLKIYIYLALVTLVLTTGGFAYFRISNIITQNKILEQENSKYKDALAIQNNTISQLEKSNKDWEANYRKTLEKLEITNRHLNDIEISVIEYKKTLKSLKPRGENESDKDRELIINSDFNNIIRLLNKKP